MSHLVAEDSHHMLFIWQIRFQSITDYNLFGAEDTLNVGIAMFANLRSINKQVLLDLAPTCCLCL